ncbi:TIGR04283 family arsenosugar biosynthesis glycosyltransferase [Ramlibacter sp. AN1015]|uniref:TIGR04283 family arsenosugar biosynthesis glycosyltransferase n=1 Tax=Ramlibacter sp. AN1015 TaxID=3133428 RepID=UPI0030C39EBD
MSAWLRIVVPVLNEAGRLPALLRALAPMRARGAEVVVVDGGSTDTSWALACAHADRVLLAPRGRASQMNAGAEGFSGEALLFLHADTLPPPDADRLLRAALGQDRSWGRFDLRITGTHPLLPVVQRAINLRSRLSGIATGDQAMFVTAHVFRKLGGFAPLALMEDVELSTRLCRAAGPPACLRQPVETSGRRWERHGVARTVGLMWLLRAQFALGADANRLARRYGYGAAPAPASAVVAMLAKAPVAGFAKTRLAPAIGARAAARAQRRMTLGALHAVRSAALGPVALWCAPDAHHRLFRALARHGGVTLHAQPPGDLGERLGAAMRSHFLHRPELPLLLIGTDCAVLAPGHLQAAAALLRDHDAVMIPAEDGGYVLLGLARPMPQLFSAGMPWSSPEVARCTRERLRASGARWCELDALWDIDDARDWQRLQQLTATATPPTGGSFA